MIDRTRLSDMPRASAIAFGTRPRSSNPATSSASGRTRLRVLFSPIPHGSMPSRPYFSACLCRATGSGCPRPTTSQNTDSSLRPGSSDPRNAAQSSHGPHVQPSPHVQSPGRQVFGCIGISAPNRSRRLVSAARASITAAAATVMLGSSSSWADFRPYSISYSGHA
mgnify:CR=1 FL=1